MIVRQTTIALVLLVAGCAAQRFDVPVSHPANPTAAEAPAPPTSTTLDSESLHPVPRKEDTAPGAGHADHTAGQAAADAPYQCPMHPDVRSDKPGRCPRCGMQLQRGGDETHH